MRQAPVTRNREVTKLLDGIIIKEFEEQGLSEGKAKEQLKKIKKSPEKYERKLQVRFWNLPPESESAC